MKYLKFLFNISSWITILIGVLICLGYLNYEYTAILFFSALIMSICSYFIHKKQA
ncbi:hypothetical protein M2475_002241 [Breznakia sp. PF5-3]|nr:hypothetical protein [Breznakia sp. PM6-1]MDF9836659.1 hypothetical protein [Breznakia sp. PF5-3]MDF9838694.1 hypothetical protein [Breznakia sp. PFB2-8]MDF9860725.1 hypothetical protein [Breznakia sp. PH5-24]